MLRTIIYRILINVNIWTVKKAVRWTLIVIMP